MKSPITIAYLVACCIYFAVSLVIVLVGKNHIPKKFIVISTVVSSLLFVAFSIYFWTAGAKTEVQTPVMYCSALSVGVLLSITIPPCLFCVKNAMLIVKNAINENPQQKEKIALLIGYEKLKKKGIITKEEYEQKENELFGDDDLKADDVVGTDGVADA